ncbi:heparinase II/III domain-containing protein [Kribbella antibiotica]|uniref:heparinase II/III domain-containing protein n=1 Tax=Kribbella antibiotica TaxID=190195 RepID=UPI001EDFB485|nr:heparinase II/III family protein [Kribbella antibiotica]
MAVPDRVSEPLRKPVPTVVQQSAPVASTPSNAYTCAPYSGIERPNPVGNLYRDTFAWGTTPPYRVGDGHGDVNWRLNPADNPSWYMWLHSLRWLGQGIRAAGKGDKRALQRVDAIAHDWVRDNPYPWRSDAGATESTMHRTNVLICLRQAVQSGLRVGRLPPAYRWIDAALLQHSQYLQRHWSGDWNHGTEESLALFGVGCTLGRAELKRTAADRLTAGIKTAIDAQGSTNEQSTAYAQYNYSLWGRAIDVLGRCGVEASPTIKARRQQLANWLALATNSLGYLHQLGDSEVVKTAPVAGTPLEYAGTLGTRGTRPVQRVGVFDAGYVFGRTGWGVERPFGAESTYSIRFGPVRRLHGHDDHMSLTYTSLGRDVLIDGGHAGYQGDEWQRWARGASAHNVMTVSGVGASATRLTRSVVQETSEYYELRDAGRTRGVLVLKDPDLMVVLDRGSSAVRRSYETLWHLPAGQQVTPYGQGSVVAQRPGDTVKTVLLQVPYGEPTAPAQVESSWHYRTIDKRSAAPVVGFTRSGRTASILSVIVPAKATAAVRYTTSQRAGQTLLHLQVGAVRATVAIAADGTLKRA